MKKAAGRSGSLAIPKQRVCLSSASDFGRFGINATPVESVINDLSHSGNVRIYIHPIARCEVADDTLSGDFAGCASQFRKPPCLNVINSLKPLSQRQAFVQIHDLLSLLIN